MSFDKITKYTSSVLEQLSNTESFPLPVLVAKANQALRTYPEDATIGQMSEVLARLASSKTFISRAELKQYYRHFYTRNNHFPEVFAAEMGDMPKLQGPKYAERHEDGPAKLDLDKYSDPILANALESAFDKTKPLKAYSQKVADRANEMVSKELTSFGFSCRTEIMSGTERSILIHAQVETPKGFTNFYVPVETTADHILPPSMFFSNRGVEDFNKKNTISYVQHNAGTKLAVTADQMIGLIRQAEAGDTTVNTVELALTKLNSTKEQPSEYFSGQILGLSLDPVAAPQVSVPQLQDPEIQSFADQFDSPVGRANFKFGERNVTNARNTLISEFSSLGYGKPQVSVSDCNDKSVSFAVKLEGTAFTVPYGMTSKATPNLFIINGSVRELSKANIDLLMRNQVQDNKAAAVASGLYGTKPSELLETLRAAMSSGELKVAEDTLNALSQSGDTKAYQTGMVTYMGSLGASKVATASVATTQCSRIVKNAHSKFPTCGHTGLPVHKVYQDRNGDCQPQYRKNMEETYEGGYFMTHKVIF